MNPENTVQHRWVELRPILIALVTFALVLTLLPGTRLDGLDSGRPCLTIHVPFPSSKQANEAKQALDETLHLLGRGNRTKALDRLSDALEADPMEPHLAMQLGEILIAIGQMKPAKEWLKRIESGPLPEDMLPQVRRARFVLRDRK